MNKVLENFYFVKEYLRMMWSMESPWTAAEDAREYARGMIEIRKNKGKVK